MKLEEEKAPYSEDELMQRATMLADDLLEMELLDTQTAYTALYRKRTTMRRKIVMAAIVRYAAMLALPLFLGCGVLCYMLLQQQKTNETMVQVHALEGSVARYELPDGSVAWLNAGSRLSYPLRFGSSVRRVTLQGEAYFDVKGNREYPFEVVTSSGLKVHVYGTRFNVLAYDDSKQVETSLEKGIVEVSLPDNKHTYKLHPGQHLIYNKVTKGVERLSVDVDEKVAWKEGELIFRNASMDEIFKRLERRFNVLIEYHNHHGKDYRYRATFRNESLTQILEYLEKSASMKWRIENIKTSSENSNKQKKVVVDLY